MASIGNDPGGKRRILFYDEDGKRRTVRLGKCSKRDAESVKSHVEALVASRISKSTPPDATVRWATELGDTLYGKLAAVGLVEEREASRAVALKEFCDDFLASRAGLKPSTRTVRQVVINDLVAFFGPDRDVTTITAGDADDFRQNLIARPLAPATVHKRLQWARWFFEAMRKRKLVTENPFAEVSVKATGIRDKLRFVTREETERILEACPSADWRAIAALARYGGLRTPSETLSLKWADIDWNADRVIVTSPKLSGTDKATRVMPLFPELKSVLAEVWEAAPEGAVYVVNERFRIAANGPAGWVNSNLRTQFHRIIRRAGLVPWNRPFQNLRSSRETELVEDFPIHVVTDWLGNSPNVAMRHYLQTTEAHFERAVSEPVQVARKAARNPAQYTTVFSSNASQPEKPPQSKTPVFSGDCGGTRRGAVYKDCPARIRT